MFKLVTSLALTAGLITQPSIAGEIFVADSQITCSDEKTVLKVINESGETPMLKMTNLRYTNGMPTENVSILFMNIETKTWTLVERFNEETFCVIGLGNEIIPYGKK